MSLLLVHAESAAQPDQQDHRCDSPHNAEHREENPHFVRFERRQGLASNLQEIHGSGELH